MIYRSAITGRFITKEAGEKNPDTTVVHDYSKDICRPGRVEGIVDENLPLKEHVWTDVVMDGHEGRYCKRCLVFQPTHI